MNTKHYAYTKISFLKSVADLNQLPPDLGAEVAFVGRSNVGKSSSINAITGVHRVARTSKTPGRTQLINLFELGPNHRLVDLPGYGYAKVPKPLQAQWQTLIGNYMTTRKSLAGLILVMDIRHPLKELDWQMIEWSEANEVCIHILLNKADKLKRGPALDVARSVLHALERYQVPVSAQLFSAFNHSGVDDAKAVLDRWLGASAQEPITSTELS